MGLPEDLQAIQDLHANPTGRLHSGAVGRKVHNGNSGWDITYEVITALL
jgi:hypothetical protein